MATLRGKWQWNDTLGSNNLPELGYVPVNFSCNGVKYQAINFGVSTIVDTSREYIEYEDTSLQRQKIAIEQYSEEAGHWFLSPEPEYRIIDFGVEEQYVDYKFYLFLIANATHVADKSLPILQGKWYFKEHIQTLGENVPFDTYVTFHMPAWSDEDHSHIFTIFRMAIDPEDGTLEYFDTELSSDSGLVVYEDGNWLIFDDNAPSHVGLDTRNIWFSEPQVVSEEFYNWFTKNAVPRTIEGTWRFNKNITGAQTFVRSDTNAIFTSEGEPFSELLMDGHSIIYINDLGDPSTDQAPLVYDMITGWEDESYRIINFISSVDLTPDFAIWFYENAHSMELKLYSECYIAETADKIRECANDSTLTFKVSDLADGVQLAYDAGYSKGSSENSVDLEALGALCEFDWSTDSNSYPIFTVINHHPTYYLHADVSSTTNGNIFVIDNDEWNPGNGEDPVDYDTDLGTKSSTITVEPNDSYSCYIKVNLSSLTPSGAGVNTVYLKNMRWTASE
jgi:hypothetical protein